MTSSILVLTDGGRRLLRVLDARFAHRGARYHLRARRRLRRSRRSSILALTSRRWWMSAASRTVPPPTQHIPGMWLPLSMPPATSRTFPPPLHPSLNVKGHPSPPLALPAPKSLRAFAGRQGLHG